MYTISNQFVNALSLLCSRASLFLFITCKAGHWSEVRFRLHQFLMLFLEADQRPVPKQIRGEEKAGLASHGGSKTGGHSHGTRAHQQVLVMGAILGLRVRGGEG